MTIKRIEITQENYEQILEVAKGSTSRTDLLKKLGWNKGVRYFEALNDLLIINSFNPKLFLRINKNIVIEEYKKENLEKIVAQSYSYSGVLKLLNKTCSAASVNILKKHIVKHSIDISHFQKITSLSLENKEMFIENSQSDTGTVKKRILKDKLIPYKCHGEGCLIKNKWLGKKIVLQLEHKNGINKDNRLENLEFLCPNCHSLTPTHSGRNIKNKSGREKHLAKILAESESQIRLGVLAKERNEKNLLQNILPQCKSIRQALSHPENKKPTLSHNSLVKLLEKNKEEKTVIEFLAQSKEKVKYPQLDILLSMVKERGFTAVSRELKCSDNAIKKHLLSRGIDLEKELKGNKQEEFFKTFDKKLFLENVLPKFFTFKSVCEHYGLNKSQENHQMLKNLLEENKNHQNVKKFIKRSMPKRIAYPAIKELVQSVKKIGLTKTAKELGGSHASLRAYLIKHNIEPKVWAKH